MITIATTDSHFDQILALQQRYIFRALSLEQQAAEGFVFAEHTAPILKQMAAELPQAIALHDEKVVGYCLSMPLSLAGEVKGLEPMFDQFARCNFRGQPLANYKIMVGGQVCVDREFRGQGLLSRLYNHVRQSLPPNYDLCVTEIASRNRISIRAHEKMGFEAIASYSDGQEDWVIVAWDLRKSS